MRATLAGPITTRHVLERLSDQQVRQLAALSNLTNEVVTGRYFRKVVLIREPMATAVARPLGMDVVLTNAHVEISYTYEHPLASLAGPTLRAVGSFALSGGTRFSAGMQLDPRFTHLRLPPTSDLSRSLTFFSTSTVTFFDIAEVYLRAISSVSLLQPDAIPAELSHITSSRLHACLSSTDTIADGPLTDLFHNHACQSGFHGAFSGKAWEADAWL